jgi:serine/threonine protein kinase
VPVNLRGLVPFVAEEVRRDRGEEEKSGSVETPIQPVESREVTQFVEPTYKQYRCSSGDPLSCERQQPPVEQNLAVTYCQDCGFPAPLSEKAEIRGSRGRYRVERLLGRRGLGRLYQGIQVSNHHSVVIKEYLLPDRLFNQAEAKLRKDTFQQVAGVSLADGRVQDFRLCHPWEAIADENQERCYLITQGNLDLYPTLRDYLTRHGAMSAIAVREVLNQVLQTLEFLHTQKIRLPSGQVQHGLAHGNLRLDSLLIAKNQASEIRRQNGMSLPNRSNNDLASGILDSDFFIYVCDLALWERLFEPPTSKPHSPSFLQDLKDLGNVSFYLLAGETTVNPEDEQQWPIVNFALKAFIKRLIGIGSSFESAEAARKALLKLPPETTVTQPRTQVVSEEENVKIPRLLFLVLGLLGLVLLGLLIWSPWSKSEESESASDEPLLCCIRSVSGIPAGKFKYTGEQSGIWRYILQQKNLVRFGQTLEDELKRLQPK